jgi:hypothetical protein
MPLGTGTINTAPQGAFFMHVPRKSSKPKAGPVRLELNGKPCGCTFRYSEKGGFTFRCKVHKTRREGIAEMRREANKVIYVFRPEPKPIKKSKKFQADSPELVQAIRAECKRRTVIARKERAKIDRPTKKLTKAQLAHLHTFAFSSEQVRKEILAAS